MAIADDRAKAVELALSQIEKQFGKGSIVRLGSREALVPISVISTGSISFDAALGVGGIPRGRVIEIYGPESSGKTTITLQIIAEAQRLGGLAAFVDAEREVDAERTGRNAGNRRDRPLLAEPHDRALAELLLDLPDRDVERLEPFTIETVVLGGTGGVAVGSRHRR
ncbi:MAG TPA: hypothetical protein VHA37_04135, partial [Candidatus Saccharimonadales bacterium]|nr:hypothetical protein [Candidatus Saccharimonadales bacterium]